MFDIFITPPMIIFFTPSDGGRVTLYTLVFTIKKWLAGGNTGDSECVPESSIPAPAVTS